MTSLVPLPRSRPVCRYAPSPTGRLHLGNLRTALLAWQACRARGGIFILRIEDIDAPRTVAGAEEQMLEDLRWLGIDWDEGPDVGGPAGPYRQSERSEIYQAALDRLTERGLTYLCTCSRRDLSEASAPHGPEGFIYPGTCREKDPAQQAAHPLGAATRLRVDSLAPIQFHDGAQGDQVYDLTSDCGDFVIRRRDGLWAYQLACGLDDALMGVTDVLRGEDLLSSTPRQIAVMQSLGLPVPNYTHIGLVADETGARMSKRDGSASLDELRSQGMPPEQVREAILKMRLL